MANLAVYKDIPPKDFTLNSFLSNPTGDAGTQAVARKATLDVYGLKLKNVLANKHKSSKLTVNYLEAGGSLFIHLLIPSETFEKFYYDIVIEFEDFDSSKTNIETNRIKFFSNSPSFAFTYAHVFQVFGIFIESLSGKYPDRIFEDIPKVRNPDYATFYEKTITFALLYLRNNNLTNIDNFRKLIKKVPVSKIDKGIAHLEDKMTAYAVSKQSEARKKKAEKRKLARKSDVVVKKAKSSKVISTVNNKVNSRVNSRVNNKVKMKVK